MLTSFNVIRRIIVIVIIIVTIIVMIIVIVIIIVIIIQYDSPNVASHGPLLLPYPAAPLLREKKTTGTHAEVAINNNEWRKAE